MRKKERKVEGKRLLLTYYFIMCVEKIQETYSGHPRNIHLSVLQDFGRSCQNPTNFINIKQLHVWTEKSLLVQCTNLAYLPKPILWTCPAELFEKHVTSLGATFNRNLSQAIFFGIFSRIALLPQSLARM